MEFCDRLSTDTGRPYRLLSEAEWEYACRAGTTTPFYFGETLPGGLANFEFPPTDRSRFPPNAFGLHNMHGNIWEWCADHRHDHYQGAPTDGSAWLTDNQAADRLLRGGAWYNNPRHCRSAYRSWIRPNYGDYLIGFRVVCTAA